MCFFYQCFLLQFLRYQRYKQFSYNNYGNLPRYLFLIFRPKLRLFCHILDNKLFLIPYIYLNKKTPILLGAFVLGGINRKKEIDYFFIFYTISQFYFCIYEILCKTMQITARFLDIHSRTSFQTLVMPFHVCQIPFLCCNVSCLQSLQKYSCSHIS